MVGRRRVLLVHSPLLGPGSWEPVARALEGHGWLTAVPDLRPVLAGRPPYYPALFETAVAGLPADGSPVVVVGHSRAGPLLPGIASALGSRVTSVVFLDARLPHPGQSWLDSLRPEQAEQLRAQVQDGMLRRWDRWFAPDAVAGLLPDQDVRDRFVAGLPQVPWTLVTEPMPPGDCSDADRGYVQLSEAYLAVADRVQREGYRVLRREADHLAMLTRPALVGELLRTMIG